MLVSLEVRLSFPCDACDTGIPVNGPLPVVKCARCLEVTALEKPRGWDTLLSRSVFVHAVRHARPLEVGRSESTSLNLSTTLRFPPCPGCGKDHDARKAKLAVLKGTPLTCGCGVALPIQPVPAHFLAVHPFVKGFVDAELFEESSASAAPVAAAGPVVMACMKCQATLPVDGTKRLVECGYCTARNYLPDDLWLALHPVAKKASWFVLFDGDALLDSIGM